MSQGKFKKKYLSLTDIEFLRKTCRALNIVCSVRKKAIKGAELKRSLDLELSNIINDNRDKEELIKQVMEYNEDKEKYTLNWR